MRDRERNGVEMALAFESFDPSEISLHTRNGNASGDHFVEFYGDDPSLVSSLRTFVAQGINEGEPAIIVATPEHREALDEALGRSIDLQAAREDGLYVTLDAQETLSHFMKDGLPDAEAFDVVPGQVIRDIAGGRNVRVFGEMVALLWAQGNVTGALELEQLWNDFGEMHPLQLFCAYPAESFNDEDRALFSIVCGHHSRIIIPATTS